MKNIMGLMTSLIVTISATAQGQWQWTPDKPPPVYCPPKAPPAVYFPPPPPVVVVPLPQVVVPPPLVVTPARDDMATKEDIARVLGKLDVLGNKVEQYQKENRAEFQKLHAGQAQLAAGLADVQKTQVLHGQMIASIQSDIVVIKSDIVGIRGDITAVRSEVANLNAELKEQSRKLWELAMRPQPQASPTIVNNYPPHYQYIGPTMPSCCNGCCSTDYMEVPINNCGCYRPGFQVVHGYVYEARVDRCNNAYRLYRYNGRYW